MVLEGKHQWIILTHKSCRIGDIGAHFAIDLDEPLHADFLHLVPCQGVLQAVPKEDDEGQTLPQFVGTGGGTRSLRRNKNKKVETTIDDFSIQPG